MEHDGDIVGNSLHTGFGDPGFVPTWSGVWDEDCRAKLTLVRTLKSLQVRPRFRLECHLQGYREWNLPDTASTKALTEFKRGVPDPSVALFGGVDEISLVHVELENKCDSEKN